jgi:predicted aspartyl protease
MSINYVPMTVQDGSIVVQGSAAGQPVEFILDTGDAIGPVFTAADAQRLALQPAGELGVEGAGGASAAYATTADVTLGKDTWQAEPSAIDPALQGRSLIGLPFFLRECSVLTFDFRGGMLVMMPA